jgi:hydrogenase nickel incorporation protein HypB
MDAIGFFDFDLESVTKRAKAINPDIHIFPVSAKTGQGMEAWTNWLAGQISAHPKK